MKMKYGVLKVKRSLREHKQAGAELCQAQVKLLIWVSFEVGGKSV